MNATQTTGNGRVRKTLASQIDRLDEILNGLSEGISEAVAVAVSGTMTLAVKEAVQAVLTEVLTNPALQQHLKQEAQPDPAPERKSLLSKLWSWTNEKVRQAGHIVKVAALIVADRVRTNWVAASAFVGVAAYAARNQIVSAASTVWGWARNLGSALGLVSAGFACGET